jgi:hypothetical protein
MIRYLCRNIHEVNYIIGKYNYTYSKGELKTIQGILNIQNYIYLIKNPIFISSFCAQECDNCTSTKNCFLYTLNIKSVSNIMREEKLKRILE